MSTGKLQQLPPRALFRDARFRIRVGGRLDLVFQRVIEIWSATPSLYVIIIMFAIPFGFVGAIVGHVLMGYSLSVISMFGIVALAVAVYGMLAAALSRFSVSAAFAFLVIGAVIDFVAVAFILFLMVRAYNNMKAKDDEEAGPTEEESPASRRSATARSARTEERPREG